jgi:hypothetical protein
MKSNGTLMQRNVAALMLFCSMGICLPASGLYGQAPPTTPPAGAVTPAVQPAATAPFQVSPVTLPPNPPLPLSLNLGSWLGRSTVYISVNGRPERLGLSTGLNANAVSPATVARLQIPEGKTKVRVDILDRETEVPETTLESLQFGLVKLENVPVAQVDVVALLSHAPHPDAPGGWLGTPFLSAFQVTLDVSRKVCVLNRPLTKMPAGAMVVPMTLRDGRIYVPVTLPKSKPFPALLDTSAVLSLIPASVGEKLKLPAVETFKLGGAGGKEVPATMIEAPTVTVGKAECKAMRVVYLSADSSPSFGRETAVLGLDFLSRFKMVLDFAAKKVAFVPLTTPESDTTPKPDAPRPKPGSPRHP